MEAGTQTGPTGDIRQVEGGEPSGQDAIRRVADKPPKDQATHDSALDWLLSDEPEETDDDTLPLRLNVGGAREGTEKWIIWTIQSVDGEVIRRIRRTAAGQGGGRQARRAAQGGDDELANRRIVVAGTADPDLKAAAGQKGIADPATLVEQKFRKKPGLVQQLVMEILSLSGYDDDDVREVGAAGN